MLSAPSWWGKGGLMTQRASVGEERMGIAGRLCGVQGLPPAGHVTPSPFFSD